MAHTREQVVRIICANCPHPCEPFQAGQIDPADPEAECPVEWVGRWRRLRPAEERPTPYVFVSGRIDMAGRSAWLWLHREASLGRLTLERLRLEFEPMIPRYNCRCLVKYLALLKKIPFRPGDEFNWTVDLHNAVNAELLATGLPEHASKRQWTYEEARALYPAPVV